MSDIIVTLTYTEAEAREVMRAIHYFDSNVSVHYEDHDRMNLIRSAIGRALPKPKPDEPTGLGAVVRDADGDLWVRRSDVHFICPKNPNEALTWAEVEAVEVLSEGWSE